MPPLGHIICPRDTSFTLGTHVARGEKVDAASGNAAAGSTMAAPLSLTATSGKQNGREAKPTR